MCEQEIQLNLKEKHHKITMQSSLSILFCCYLFMYWINS